MILDRCEWSHVVKKKKRAGRLRLEKKEGGGEKKQQTGIFKRPIETTASIVGFLICGKNLLSC